jgi:hypothetical protein
MKKYTPNDMVELRDEIEDALKARGFVITGAGVSMLVEEPEADLDIEVDGATFNLSLKPRGV